MNKTILTGRLTKDPELRYIQGSGTAVSTVTIAVDNYNSKTGEKGADFIPVVVWGKQAENLAQYMSKGSMIGVTGRISTRNYTAQDGTKKYVTEVVADMGGIEFLSKGSGNSGNNGAPKQNNGTSQQFNAPASDSGVPGFDAMGADFGDMTPVDEGDMPF